MSCEIFCCEIEEILTMLVDENSGELLDKLLSILDGEDSLDNYLAGYFEKIVEMLLRTNTGQTIEHLNKGGINLFKKFVKHVNNYSVMQIIQRLMLPHFSINQNEHDKIDSEEICTPQCNWSFSSVTCEILCSTLVENDDDENRASHISDLLITVLQLSPPESLFIANLCSSICLEILFPVALDVNSSEGSNLNPIVIISALSVLESLTARLCESLNTHEYSSNLEMHFEEEGKDATKQNLDNLRESLKTFIPYIAAELSKQNQEIPTYTFTAQDQCSYKKLGIKSLQLVKFVESIVRLSDPCLDEIICSGDILQICVKMLFEFELNSLLHLAVQRIICMIIEGSSQRKSIQKHLIDECKIIEEVSRFFKEKMRVGNPSTSNKRPHIPVTGHIVLIVQTILNCMDRSTPDVSFESCSSTHVNEGNVLASSASPVDGNETCGDKNTASEATDSFRGLLADKMDIWTELIENSYREYVAPSLMPIRDDTEFDAAFSNSVLDEYDSDMMTSGSNIDGVIVLPATTGKMQNDAEDSDDDDDELDDGTSNFNDTSSVAVANKFTSAVSDDTRINNADLQSDIIFSDQFADFEGDDLPQQQDDFANFDASFEANFESMSINSVPVHGSLGVDSVSTVLTSASSSNIDPFGDDKVDVSILK